MKKLVSLFLMLFSTSVIATDNPFVGTWTLVSGEYMNEKGELITYESLGITSQKVINKSHFSFVSKAKDKFWSAGSGMYRFTDTQYFESLELASFKLEHNGTYPFNYELKGDTWRNSRFKNGVRVEYEVWQRR